MKLFSSCFGASGPPDPDRATPPETRPVKEAGRSAEAFIKHNESEARQPAASAAAAAPAVPPSPPPWCSAICQGLFAQGLVMTVLSLDGTFAVKAGHPLPPEVAALLSNEDVLQVAQSGGQWSTRVTLAQPLAPPPMQQQGDQQQAQGACPEEAGESQGHVQGRHGSSPRPCLQHMNTGTGLHSRQSRRGGIMDTASSRVSMLLRSSMDMTFLEEVAAAAETGDGAAAGDSAAQGVEHSTLLGTSPRQGFLSPSSASNPQSSAGLHAGSSLQGMASNASAGIAQAGGPHSLQAQRSRPLSIELNKGDAQQGRNPSSQPPSFYKRSSMDLYGYSAGNNPGSPLASGTFNHPRTTSLLTSLGWGMENPSTAGNCSGTHHAVFSTSHTSPCNLVATAPEGVVAAAAAAAAATAAAAAAALAAPAGGGPRLVHDPSKRRSHEIRRSGEGMEGEWAIAPRGRLHLHRPPLSMPPSSTFASASANSSAAQAMLAPGATRSASATAAVVSPPGGTASAGASSGGSQTPTAAGEAARSRVSFETKLHPFGSRSCPATGALSPSAASMQAAAAAARLRQFEESRGNNSTQTSELASQPSMPPSLNHGQEQITVVPVMQAPVAHESLGHSLFDVSEIEHFADELTGRGHTIMPVLAPLHENSAVVGQFLDPPSLPAKMEMQAGIPIVVEVTFSIITHNMTQEAALLVVQQDVSTQAKVEQLLADLTESQLAVIAGILPKHVIEFMTGTGTMGMAMASPKEPGLLHRTSGPCYSRTSRPHSAVGALDANSTERQNQACMGNQEAAGASGANNTNSQLAAMNSGGSASANHRRGSTGGQGAIGALSQGQQGQGQQEMMGVEASDSSVAMLDALARKHEDVTLLFMDICGYTSMSEKVEPKQVMQLLNQLFTLFDGLCTRHNVHKVETAGDCYIVSGGIAEMDEDGFLRVLDFHDPADSARRVFDFAKDMLVAARTVCLPHNGEPVRVRVGMHTGPVVTGVIGLKLPKFGVFGDSMNTASRMESTGIPGRIQVSAATHALLQEDGDEWEATGGIEVKGKGVMQTYLWVEPPAPPIETSSHAVESSSHAVSHQSMPSFLMSARASTHSMIGGASQGNPHISQASLLAPGSIATLHESDILSSSSNFAFAKYNQGSLDNTHRRGVGAGVERDGLHSGSSKAASSFIAAASSGSDPLALGEHAMTPLSLDESSGTPRAMDKGPGSFKSAMVHAAIMGSRSQAGRELRDTAADRTSRQSNTLFKLFKVAAQVAQVAAIGSVAGGTSAGAASQGGAPLGMTVAVAGRRHSAAQVPDNSSSLPGTMTELPRSPMAGVVVGSSANRLLRASGSVIGITSKDVPTLAKLIEARNSGSSGHSHAADRSVHGPSARSNAAAVQRFVREQAQGQGQNGARAPSDAGADSGSESLVHMGGEASGVQEAITALSGGCTGAASSSGCLASCDLVVTSTHPSAGTGSVTAKSVSSNTDKLSRLSQVVRADDPKPKGLGRKSTGSSLLDCP